LPRKPGKIRKAFVDALGRGETLVIYESPFRAAKTLELLAEVAPEALVCACRELTKHFEETLRGTAGEVAANLRARKEVKGEFTIVIAHDGRCACRRRRRRIIGHPLSLKQCLGNAGNHSRDAPAPSLY
jgi:16S rRNA (cytidine1402-2'-O)-methyltransferase